MSNLKDAEHMTTRELLGRVWEGVREGGWWAIPIGMGLGGLACLLMYFFRPDRIGISAMVALPLLGAYACLLFFAHEHVLDTCRERYYDWDNRHQWLIMGALLAPMIVFVSL